MKKFIVKLINGRKITVWSTDAQKALNDTEQDYPNQIAGVEDHSPFNSIEIPKPKEQNESGR